MGFKVLMIPVDDYKRYSRMPWEDVRVGLGLPEGTVKGKQNAYSVEAFTSRMVAVRFWHPSFEFEPVEFDSTAEVNGAFSNWECGLFEGDMTDTEPYRQAWSAHRNLEGKS